MRIRTEHPGLGELADRAGLTVADTGRVDAVLLGGPGAWDHARALRAGGHTVPLVVLTDGAPALDRARLEPVVLLRELDGGALREALRMCAVGRPAGRVRLASGTADLDLGRFDRVDGTREPLSSLECRFVGYLAARTGRAASRDELQLQVWDHRRPVATRAVDMLVARLRRKIEEDPRHPTALLTASGGYRLLVDTGSPQISGSPALVGRDALVRDLRTALDDHGALLLVGPPGVGKTAVARALVGDGRPATWIDLSTDDAEARLATVGPDLLVLDGVEARADLWEAVLQGPPRALLGTSRFVVGSSAIRRVPPLDAAAAEQLLRREAERMGIGLTVARTSEVLEPLDGLPRAIHRMAERLRTLGGDAAGPGAVLAGDIASSWTRLEPGMQTLLASLATVAGPFDAGVAMVVAPQTDAFDWVGLVDAQLVEPDGERFRLLQAVRSYARSALPEVWEAALQHHLVWVHGEVVGLARRLRRRGARQLVARLAAREEDLQRAWSTALDGPDEVRLPDLAVALDRLEGPRDARRRRLEEALDVLEDPVARARVGVLAARLDRHRDRAASRASMVACAEALWDAAPDEAVRAAVEAARLAANLEPWATTRTWLQGLPVERLDPTSRKVLQVRLWELEELEGLRRTDDVLRDMMVLADDLAELGDLEGAVDAGLVVAPRLQLTGLGDPVAHMERVVAWAREIDRGPLLANTLVHLASRLGEVRRTDEALQALDEAAALFRPAEPLRLWQVTQYRGFVLANGGRHREARRALEDYLGWCRGRNARFGVADALLWLAALELDADAPHRAEALARQVADVVPESAHLVLHARMYEAHARLALGDVEGARTLVAPIATDGGYGYEQAEIALLRRALGEPQDDRIAAIGAAMSGSIGETLRALHAGVDVPPGMLTARILARLWALGSG